MELKKKTDFQNVEALCQALKAERISSERFHLAIPIRDCANGLYAAMKAVVESRGRPFFFDDATRFHILEVAKWLTDPNERPGLRLGGLYGNGKTSLALAVQWLVSYLTEKENGYSNRMTFKFYTAKEICTLCGAGEKFKQQYDEYQRIFQEPLLIIDDLGDEPKEVMVYGMVHTPIMDIINSRYASRKLTVITSNLNSDELDERYGGRIADRFKEMLKTVIFKNESYRIPENHHKMDNS